MTVQNARQIEWSSINSDGGCILKYSIIVCWLIIEGESICTGGSNRSNAHTFTNQVFPVQAEISLILIFMDDDTEAQRIRTWLESHSKLVIKQGLEPRYLMPKAQILPLTLLSLLICSFYLLSEGRDPLTGHTPTSLPTAVSLISVPRALAWTSH